MNRRAFMSGLAFATLAGPRAALAQPARKVARIGILSTAVTAGLVGPRPRWPTASALLEGLGDLGYVYGRHFVTEARGGERKPERFPGLAAELVRLQVDVIVAAGPALPALKQATSTIPVVMAAADDPVGLGLVQSLGHPGRSFTGWSNQFVETTGQRLELLEGPPRCTGRPPTWTETRRRSPGCSRASPRAA